MYRWQSGNTYQGEYENDKPHGFGTKKWATSGATYEGQWRHGRRVMAGTRR